MQGEEKNESHQDHVVFSLKKAAKKKSEIKLNNQKIHDATYKLKQLCKKLYKNSIEINNHYPHRRDTVFFIQYNHNANSWTLYKPSFIPYEQFSKLAKKVYRNYGLQVVCDKDKLVIINQHDLNLEDQYVTLDELEDYKKKSDEDISLKIKTLQDNVKNDHTEEIKELEKIQKIKNFLFWHLQIPTTGILPSEQYDIDNQYKPLAWHFLLWDLAPKKGAGAHVAMIDTGVSAFNIEEKEFSTSYKKNINITIEDNLLDYGYNLISEHGLDPIRQITINFGHYCNQEMFNSEKLMQDLPEWIIEFVKNKNSFQIEQYFLKHAKNEYLNESKSSLNKKGEEVLKDLLHGKYGIAQSETNPFFHIVNLKKPYNQEVLLETLPAPKIIGNKDPFAAGHGTFTQGIVNGQLYNNLGIQGLAPHAHVSMIKAFNDNGTTNKTTLNAALQRAQTLKKSIVSMSLKITDDIDNVKDAPLKALIDSFDYVVAASGNDGKKLKNKEAYPAKFDSVAFDVGAFQYDKGEYSICQFTQKEMNIGPKFVAPGFNILSAGLTPNQTEDSMYVFMSGTSIAVPIITGFLALVLAEFQDIFSREQILKVIYKFSMKLNHDEIWQNYIKIGTPDMRSSLLCLHVLASLKNILEKDEQFSFDKSFDNLVQAIYTINYYAPSYSEKILGFSFTQNFANYNHATSLKKVSHESINFFTPEKTNINSCVDFIKNVIISIIDEKKYYTKSHDFDIKKHPELLKSLTTTIATKKINLFSDLSLSSQNRINSALAARNLLFTPEV